MARLAGWGIGLVVLCASCFTPVAERCVADAECGAPAQCIQGLCALPADGGLGGGRGGGTGGSLGGGTGGGLGGGTGGGGTGGGGTGGGGTGGGLGGGMPGNCGGGGGGVVTSLRALVPCSSFDLGFGAPVPLQNATATFSQSSSGPFTVARAIDGDPAGGFGWAIFPQVSRNQSAAFETAQDTTGQFGGTRLLIKLHHSFFTEHALGRFRLSVTTSPRSTFADGNEGISMPGDVGSDSIWTTLTPRRMCVSTNASMVANLDDSVRVGDTNATLVDYVIEADTNLCGITGIRLEALTDSGLPFNGPGCNDTNGNFVLSEFTVRAGPRLPP